MKHRKGKKEVKKETEGKVETERKKWNKRKKSTTKNQNKERIKEKLSYMHRRKKRDGLRKTKKTINKIQKARIIDRFWNVKEGRKNNRTQERKTERKKEEKNSNHSIRNKSSKLKTKTMQHRKKLNYRKQRLQETPQTWNR